MNYLDQYTIPFTGLKPGSHEFGFRLDKKFFEQFDHSEVTDGELAVEVYMEKEERLFDLRFVLKGDVTVACDRCNAPLSMPLDGTERLLVKLGDGNYEESEEVQVIPESDHQLELGSLLFEYVQLMLPARRVHPEEGPGGCDPDVIRLLTHQETSTLPDPRWDILKGLKNTD